MYEHLASTDSTNNYLKRMIASGIELDNLYTVYTSYQTAGRGQAGNSWESEDGKNLLFSTILRPQHLLVTMQFRISMLTAVAIVKAIEEITRLKDVRIKWPNDIYVGNRKLVGILIENALLGNNINYSIIGVGINVNQTTFRSDAPNPVSLKQLTSEDYNIELLLERIISQIEQLLPMLDNEERLKSAYKSLLYRANGYYPYLERVVDTTPVSISRKNSEQQFMARIIDIEADGRISLELADGTRRSYHFKQIRYIINEED